MIKWPEYYIVSSNFGPAWAEDNGGEFAFVWKLNGVLHGKNTAEVDRNVEILSMMRKWCNLEKIEESWADSLTGKFKSLELIEDLDEVHKFLKMKGCHIV